MAGPYLESQSGTFQNNWLEIKVSKNLSPFLLFLHLILLLGPKGACSKLTLKGTCLAEPEPFDCVSWPLPCPHSDYSPTVCIVQTKEQWLPSEDCLEHSHLRAVCLNPQPPPFSSLGPPLWVSWVKLLQTSSQPCSGLHRAPRPGSPSFPLPTLPGRFQFPLLCLWGGCVPSLEGPWGDRREGVAFILKKGLGYLVIACYLILLLLLLLLLSLLQLHYYNTIYYYNYGPAISQS